MIASNSVQPPRASEGVAALRPDRPPVFHCMTTASSSFRSLAQKTRRRAIGRTSEAAPGVSGTSRPGDKVVEASLLLMAAVAGVFITTGIVHILLTESWPSSRRSRSASFHPTLDAPVRRWHSRHPAAGRRNGDHDHHRTVGAPPWAWSCRCGSASSPAEVPRVHQTRARTVAAVPTVVYGYFAVQFVSPLFQQGFRAVGSDP